MKAKALERDGRVSICIDDEAPPFAFVIIEGTAQVDTAPDHDEMLDWATCIAARYMGAELAEAYGKRNAVTGEYLVRVTPSKIVARKGIAD